MKLKDKVALVTGSSAGIGVGIAKGMAAEGADIIVNYCNDKAGGEQTLAAVTDMGRKAILVRADVGVARDVENLFDEIKREFGRLDILVNNAGVSPKKPFERTSEHDWDRIHNANLKSVFLCCKQAWSLMKSGGAILNISSVHALNTTYNFTAYAASKGGMEALTRGLAVEFAEKGIRVNALRIGWIVTEREPFGPDHPDYEAVCERIPLHRPGQLEDVSPTCVHLCCEDSGFLTGQCIGLDGGAEIMLTSPYPTGFVKGGAWKE